MSSRAETMFQNLQKSGRGISVKAECFVSEGHSLGQSASSPLPITAGQSLMPSSIERHEREIEQAGPDGSYEYLNQADGFWR